MAKSKTPDYIKKATANYRAKFDQYLLNMPLGTRDRVRAAGITNPELVAGLLEYIERRERETGAGPGVE